MLAMQDIGKGEFFLVLAEFSKMPDGSTADYSHEW